MLLWRSRRNDALVVYCAHDAIYSEAILKEFERRSGLPVAIRFDTEATKSLGLTELIQREKDTPRCDVFWSNELLGMADLQDRGLLEPYQGSGFARIPAAYKDPLGHWAGFAARFRVFIFNTEHLGPATTADEIARQLQAPDLSRMAIAKPLFGTTLTHYAALWQQRGAEATQAWHRDWRRRGIREVGGNAAVKDLVASGACVLGLTDTDDFFAAKDAGRPVAALPVQLADGATICIPNTVGIIRGARHPAAARQLVDYLLSADTELALARSASRQVPLGPVEADKLPAEVRAMLPWVAEGVPLSGLSAARAECLAWLRAELAR
ncbi:MAG TPA: extracellular solute-binding protein [Chthoniobacteraceae bacterium]|nr:Extracellular solute-binding protein family 1 [Chthoniobacter sp.]HEV7867905.1 extracellular solute-binding protein [Chthoniobacteraceae bacterium]